ncbi:unnamed protein product [Prunus armeniaca]|uniref:Uncharacterized protein n=1 Tax=Prunus armeniaca TaxID=36596 RepID=A0A6J5UJL2_PRUAR|nr:unnamed protein product [Prunus armeniaca]CAB4307045.1 unnamed protein product [Prunus armeniaca]
MPWPCKTLCINIRLNTQHPIKCPQILYAPAITTVSLRVPFFTEKSSAFLVRSLLIWGGFMCIVQFPFTPIITSRKGSLVLWFFTQLHSTFCKLFQERSLLWKMEDMGC